MEQETYRLSMKIQNKISFLLIISISSYLISSNCSVYSRGGGGARGGDRDMGFGNDFGRRDDSYYGGDADNRDHADLNNADHNADLDPHAADTRNYNWDGARAPLSSENFDKVNLGHITNPVTGPEMTDRGNAVRNNYNYSGLYNRNFWTAHPDAGWAYASRWGDGWAWGNTGWPTIAGWWGMPMDVMPVDYDYGNNITYQNDNVYYGSQPVETSVAYYDQAQTLAESIPVTPAQTSTKSNWKPLGVFSMVQGNQTNTTSMFQLAVNKSGAIKGSYYNPLTGETKALKGAVDKKNMRVSWTVGDNKNVVYDTGLKNLLQAQSQMLVHYGKDKTQQWSLVRLPQPKVS